MVRLMRKLILSSWLLLFAACQFNRVVAPESADLLSFSTASTRETRDYIVEEQLVLVNEGPGEPSKQNVWVALIGDVYPYQSLTKRVITPENHRIFTDEYGNQIAEFDFSGMPAGSEIQIEVETHVSVNHLAYDLSDCDGELPGFFTQPELHIESNNPQIAALAEELSAGKRTPCEQVRAFYDYVGDELVYSFNGENWGAQAALGEMGADCTEYAALTAALSRAAGIPARYLEGVLALDPASADVARTEHAWLEVYLPGAGWTAMDPTLGRSSLYREQYFAAHSPDHIIVTRGGSPSALRGASYFSHIYWPGNSAVIKVKDFNWVITEAITP